MTDVRPDEAPQEQPAAETPAPAADVPAAVEPPEPSPLSTKDKIKRAKLPTEAVEICLATDLQDEYEALEEQLREAWTREQTDKRLAGKDSTRIAQQITALQEQMREFVVTFRIRSLGKRWHDLMKQHPAREGEAEDQLLGYNPDTFFDAAIRACTVEPADLDDEDWVDLLGDDKSEGKLTAGQHRQLQDAVLKMNVRRIDLPNSRAASRILQTSESE